MPIINKIPLVGSCLLLILLAGCNSSNSQDDLQKELTSVSSWAATVEMLGNTWLKGNVPDKYTQQALNRAQTELLQEKQKISDIKPLGDVTQRNKSLIATNISSLANITRQISTAIAQNNHSLVKQELWQLQIEIKGLNKFKKNTRGEP